MRIFLNGDPHDIAASTIAMALQELGFADSVVATALNGEFVACGARESARLAEGDRLEVLAPMQGG